MISVEPMIVFSRNEGAIGLTIKAMTEHAQQEILCKRAVSLLLALAVSRDNEFMIAREGGVEAVKDSLTNHPYNADLQVISCSLLRRLIDEDQFTEIVGNVGDAGSAIASLREFPDDAMKQEAACVVLQLLVKTSPVDTAARMREEGAIELIMEAMRMHPKDLNLYSMGLATLANVSLVEGMAPLVVAAGALNHALESMNKFPDELNI